MCVNRKINIIVKLANSDNIDAKKMEFSSLDGRDDGEYNSASFVEIYETFVMQESLTEYSLLYVVDIAY